MVGAALWLLSAPQSLAAGLPRDMVDGQVCKEMSMKVSEHTDATFKGYSETRNVVFFTHPLASEISINCEKRFNLHIFVATNSPYPKDDWFKLATRAAQSMSSTPAGKLEQAIRDCHKEALTGEDGAGYSNVIDARLECYANTKDVYSWVYIHLNDAENRKVFDKARDEPVYGVDK